ncbi:MAG: type VI secretion system tube protein Hcp [Acidobacteria bacterium]|nr:type VI secretion system tube protein Hcp [Acidobacteriota bacterium]
MAVDYFLKLEGIEGESTDSKHTKEIEVLSWSWGENNPASAGQSGGKVSIGDFSFVMKVNKASPKLLEACAMGGHIKDALLTCRRAGADEQQEFLKIKMTDCLVASFQTGGASGSEFEADSISLAFAKINYDYRPQKKDGTLDGPISTNWNLKTNKKE